MVLTTRAHQVDSKDSLENVESKWVGEIAENCPDVKLVLVALKCDLRGSPGDDEANGQADHEREKQVIEYQQGLEMARRIGVCLPPVIPIRPWIGHASND